MRALASPQSRASTSLGGDGSVDCNVPLLGLVVVNGVCMD